MTTQITIADKSLDLRYATAIDSGYGHKRITVEFIHNGENRLFSATTNDMRGFDAANDLEGQEKYEALYELISYKIQEEVEEWLQEL